MKIDTFKRELRKGYIALISVIMLGALGTAIMLSVILSGITSGKTDLSIEQSGEARAMASSCAEEALQTINESGTTSSSGNLIIGSGTCTYLISSQNGQNIVNSTGYYGTVTNKVKIVISTTSPNIILSSWQEVGDF